jgi:hypothetical protein
MKQEKLNAIAIISVEKEMEKNLEFKNVLIVLVHERIAK